MSYKKTILKPPHNFLLKNLITRDDMYKNNDIEIYDCISSEIEELWSKGIRTLGCCCGHGLYSGFIQVERTSLQGMIDNGYEWYDEYPESLGGKERYDAFVSKSKCGCNNND